MSDNKNIVIIIGDELSPMKLADNAIVLNVIDFQLDQSVIDSINDTYANQRPEISCMGRLVKNSKKSYKAMMYICTTPNCGKLVKSWKLRICPNCAMNGTKKKY